MLDHGRLAEYALAHTTPHPPILVELNGRRQIIATSSHRTFAADAETGKVLWTRDARYAFRHNAIAVAGGRIFCIDRMPATPSRSR